MANLPLAFAELAAGAILMAAGITGRSLTDVLMGRAGKVGPDYQGSPDPGSLDTAAQSATGGLTPLPGSAKVGRPAVRPGHVADDLRQRLREGSGKFDPGAYGALRLGRTDQGVDFGGSGPVHAIVDGIVRSVGKWPGWPGVGGVVIDTTLGPVFVMEDFIASVHPGQNVHAGDVIGHATGGHSGIESGLANTAGTGPLTPYAGALDGTPMEGGIVFRQLVTGGLH